MGIINHFTVTIVGNNSGYKTEALGGSEMQKFDVLTVLSGPKLDKAM